MTADAAAVRRRPKDRKQQILVQARDLFLGLDGGLDATTAAMAKWWLTEQQVTVIDRCLQLYGGYGYMREYPIARMYADARVQKIYGGANEIMKDLVARSLR